MALTLEQLDARGNLDTLPYSLDNTWTAEGTCGQWYLDQLDIFSSSLDTLAFSLDSPVWQTACIKDQNVLTASASATFVADAIVIPPGILGEAHVSAQGTFVSNAFAIRTAEGDVSASATLTAVDARVRTYEADISASADVVGNAVYITNQVFSISAESAFTAIETQRLAVASGAIVSRCNVSAELRVFGEEWSDVDVEEEVWSDVTVGDEIWTERTAGTETWRG